MPISNFRFSIEGFSHCLLCLKLINAIRALLTKTSKCSICNKFYALDFANSTQIRCSECSRPSHSSCTENLCLPVGFYWKCTDCDDDTLRRKFLQRFNSSKEGNSIKIEPGNGVIENLDLKQDELENEQFDADFNDVEDNDILEEDYLCVPQKGYLCDLCQFYTFDLQTFQNHVSIEEIEVGSTVKEAISNSSQEDTTLSCIKCEVVSNNWNNLYQHVIMFHCRPEEFPQFGDIEWKFLMSQGNLKRSCTYCSQSFDSSSQWITHMQVSIDAGSEEYKIENTVGIEDLDDDMIGQDLKCGDCDEKQTFKNPQALKIHISTFHRRNKRFMCAFCSFDGDTVKDLNQHINLVHDGNFNKCLECDFETWAHSVLRRHVNVKHRKIKSFGCKHCPFTAMAKPTLVAHINREHGLNEDIANKSPLGSSINFKCCFCSFETTSKKSFQVSQRAQRPEFANYLISIFLPLGTF